MRRARPRLLRSPACAVALALVLATGAAAQEASPPGPEAAPSEAPPFGDPDFDPLFDEEYEEVEVYDPFEGGNRRVFDFNRLVDRFVWDPVTDAYRLVVPSPARRSVHRVFQNLNTPIYVVNHLLRGRPVDAAETLVAFGFNVSFGVFCTLDAASRVGLELKRADFGQTLALAGVGHGPYLVVPLLGPSTVRDGVGAIFDRAFHPLSYFLGIPTQLMWGGGIGVVYRERVADEFQALRESSIDPYSAVRSAYLQAREHSVAQSRRRPEPEPRATTPDVRSGAEARL